jgi:hypothetical protein
MSGTKQVRHGSGDVLSDTFILTNRGRFCYDDDPAGISYEDIARSLSQMPRYFGHTHGFYSVAQHSIACSVLAKTKGLPLETQFIALMHDAAEAYCGDLCKPLKDHLPRYNEIIEQVESNVAEHFGFEYPYPEIIHNLDYEVYWYERRGISSHPDVDTSMVPDPPQKVADVLSDYWSPNKAWNEFLSNYNRLQR